MSGAEPGQSGPSILVIDDDPQILRTLRINLRARGFAVEIAGDGKTAIELATEHDPDLIILDLGLPDLDGVAVLSRLRQFSHAPVIVLSARHGSDDKVEALDVGADDYVTKPFGIEELLARVRANLRRHGIAESIAPVQTEHFRLDFDTYTASVRGPDDDFHPVRLTPTEWKIVDLLARNTGRVVSQQQLLHDVWGPSYHRETNYLRVYFAQLRRKLEPDPATPRYLRTEPGVGYRLTP